MDTRTADSSPGAAMADWEARVRASRRRGGTLRVWHIVGKAAGVSAILLFTLFPVYFMLVSAFSDSTTSGAGALLPTSLTFDNFVYVMTEGNFGRYLRNSLVVAGITVAFACVLSMLAAVAVARFRFRSSARSMRSFSTVTISVQYCPVARRAVSVSSPGAVKARSDTSCRRASSLSRP